MLLPILVILYVSISSPCLAHEPHASPYFNVLDYGAVNDGEAMCTEAIQKAVHACNAAGGGTVLLPSGQYLSGKIHLKSNVTLNISKEATLLAAPGPIYGEPEGSINALIWGDELENVAITGGGTIEGKTGLTREREPEGVGRRAIGLQRCKNVKITDLAIKHGGGCTMLLLSLDGLEIGNVRVQSFWDRDPVEGGDGKDGVTLDGCRNVYVHDCEFRGSDDAFAFKCRQSGFRTVTENVKITRCTFASRTSNAIQFGSETNNDFRKIDISDITIEHAGKAGIGITMNDGHVIEDVSYRSITMRNVCAPIFIQIMDRNGVGKIRNVRFDNITAPVIWANPEYSERSPKGYWVATISGLKEQPVEDIVFNNVTLTYPGGVNESADRIAPPYPPPDYQPRKMGMRPASGFYVRHARDIEFHNLKIVHQKPEVRPAIVADNAEGILIDDAALPKGDNVECHVLARGSGGVRVRNADLVVKEAPLPESPKSVNDADGGAVALSAVPHAAQAVIKRELAGASIGDIERDTRDGRAVYRTDAELKGKDVELIVAVDGTLVRKDVELDVADLPKTIRDALEKAMAGEAYEIDDAELRTEDGKTFYKIDVDGATNSYELHIAKDGTLLEKEVED